jgi:uncharacterized protein (DUF4415 family)
MSESKEHTLYSSLEEDDVPDMSSPEWVDKFRRADLKRGDQIIRRGRPPSMTRKMSTTLRLDADVLERFRAGGAGWQTRINEALKQWVHDHPQ